MDEIRFQIQFFQQNTCNILQYLNICLKQYPDFAWSTYQNLDMEKQKSPEKNCVFSKKPPTGPLDCFHPKVCGNVTPHTLKNEWMSPEKGPFQ